MKRQLIRYRVHLTKGSRLATGLRLGNLALQVGLLGHPWQGGRAVPRLRDPGACTRTVPLTSQGGMTRATAHQVAARWST